MTAPRETEIDYGLDPVELLIRISQKQIQSFNKLNSVSIDQIRRQLENREPECVFQKTSETEHRIIIPLEEGFLDAYVQEHDISGTYEIRLKKALKTTFREKISLPEIDRLLEICKIRIIDLNDGGRENRASAEFEALQDKVSSLPIASTVNVENQQEIWFKYIEAQKALLEDLEKPFSVKGKPRIGEIRNKDHEISRYNVQFDLAHEFLSEYEQLKNKLKEFNIHQPIYEEGSIQLNREELAVLDAVITREFSDVLERSPFLGAIVKLKPQTIAGSIQRKIPKGYQVIQDTYKKEVIVHCNPNPHLKRIMKRFGLKLFEVEGSFQIVNHGNIQENRNLNQTHRITFGSRFVKDGKDFEQLFPYPEEDNIFRIRKREAQSLRIFYQALLPIYGKENILTSISSIFKPIELNKALEEKNDFSDDFWISVKRKLYPHGLEESINPSTQSLFLEFREEEELKQQFSVIQHIKDCEVVYSPLQADFRFKVKINVISTKTERELFQEKLKRLRGAEFVVEVEEEGKRRPRLQSLGNLNGNESDLQKVSLYLPNYFSDDQKKAKDAIKFLNKEDSFIRSVRANLTGDRTKIGWLENAVKKINQPTNAPNGRPVNERLGEFVFDTSKASPVYDEQKLNKDSEHYREIVKNQLLQLNESQRKAVVAAIHCEDLALLQGPPGTGKTTIIAEMIWQMIRRDPKHRILLTSETNLAVDNALDRLLNEKSVNPQLVRNMTLIKPLRFGRLKKMDEEGAKYSAERIRQWVDPGEYQEKPEELTTLDEQESDPEESGEGRPENNAVQDWMKRIANRAKNTDPKYAEALKDWALDLSYPSPPIKKMFAGKYFEYANIVGSTCSSAGSPRFMWDFSQTILGQDDEDQKKLNYRAQVAPFGRDFERAVDSLEIGNEIKNEFRRLGRTYQNERWLIQRFFNKDDSNQRSDEEERFARISTIDGIRPKNAKDTNRLESYQALVSFSQSNIAPFLEPKVLFDTVIMDEASKATPPELLLPLCFGKRSVVIGDHRQLPPMLNEKDFREALVDAGAEKLAEEIDREFTETSQFERMILNPKVSPTIISRCNIQYRMHPDINGVIKQFYLDEGGLEPAKEIADNADDPNLNNVFSRYHGLYAPDFLDPNTHTIWVDVKTPESREGTSIMNEGEVKAVQQILQMLKNAEGFQELQAHWNFIKDDFKRLQEQQIGVISFYGSQKRLLKRSLAGIGVPLKINTVDRFQGMERNIVIVSTVRSHQKVEFGKKVVPNRDSGFAKSPQRLNVALSRARRLLIVVGNKDFFGQVTDAKGRPLYKNAIDEIATSGKIIAATAIKTKEK